jgi:hypothetical protein
MVTMAKKRKSILSGVVLLVKIKEERKGRSK